VERLAQAVAGSSSLAQQLLQAASAAGAAHSYHEMEMQRAVQAGQVGGEGGEGGRPRAGRPRELVELFLAGQPFLAGQQQPLQAPEVLLKQLSHALVMQQEQQEQQAACGQVVAGQQQQQQQQQPVAEVLQGVQQALALREQLVQACGALPSRREVCVQVGQCKVVLTQPGGGTALLVLAEDGDEEV
jgi:hypothetical protein